MVIWVDPTFPRDLRPPPSPKPPTQILCNATTEIQCDHKYNVILTSQQFVVWSLIWIISPDTDHEFWVVWVNFLGPSSICNSQDSDNCDKKGQFGWGNKRDLVPKPQIRRNISRKFVPGSWSLPVLTPYLPRAAPANGGVL